MDTAHRGSNAIRSEYDDFGFGDQEEKSPVQSGLKVDEKDFLESGAMSSEEGLQKGGNSDSAKSREILDKAPEVHPVFTEYSRTRSIHEDTPVSTEEKTVPVAPVEPVPAPLLENQPQDKILQEKPEPDQLAQETRPDQTRPD